jgi:hypothetical protein
MLCVCVCVCVRARAEDKFLQTTSLSRKIFIKTQCAEHVDSSDVKTIRKGI